ncbi:MAG: acyltransferase family protein [Henriciella sp.]
MSDGQTAGWIRPIGQGGYIANLDGIRSIAILSVLIFHINPEYLPGGFSGVDLFFCISGYIITRNILIEKQERNFSFLNFYVRRYARLLPASMVTIVVTLTCARLFMSPTLFPETLTAGIYSIVSIANIYFNMHAGYFDETSELIPFLHMWSLSVEEQFYIIWPLLLIFLLPAARSSRFILFLGIFAVGGVAAAVVTGLSPDTAFYQMPFRIFQFAAGGAIASLGRLKAGALAEAVFLIGLAGFVTACVIGTPSPYSFYWSALLPAFAAAAMFIAIDARLAGLVFGNPLAVAIGRRAYSIYLVHWPIVVIWKHHSGTSLPIEAGMLVASFVAGELLYRLVENPLRIRGKKERDTYWPKFIITTASVFAVLAGTALYSTSLKSGDTTDANIAAAQIADLPGAAGMSIQIVQSERQILAGGCHLLPTEKLVELDPACYEPKAEGPNILLIGDSHALDTRIMLFEMLPDQPILMLTSAACPPMPVGTRDVGKRCDLINEARFRQIADGNYDAIVVSSNWARWEDGEFPALAEALAETGKPVILFGVRPFLTETFPTLATGPRGEEAMADLRPFLTFDADARQEALRAAFDAAGTNYQYVDLLAELCPSTCIALTPFGMPFYYDKGHMVPSSSLWLGRRLASTINIEKLTASNR